MANAWAESYRRHENYVFEPGEELVRFAARYLRRRVTLDEFVDVLPGAAGARVLDLGCGIGRHLVFGARQGFDMYGIDLVPDAITVARSWLERIGVGDVVARAVAGDVRRLPWPDQFFDYAWSDSVLDSMEFHCAVDGVRELHRVLRPSALFYCSLISHDANVAPGFAAEMVVATAHERGTVQSYFDLEKLGRLFAPWFVIVDTTLVRHEDVVRSQSRARWHLVVKKQ